jgi:nitrogen-specific signal transduction histidine kinase
MITVTRDVSRQSAAERARDRFREAFLQSQKLEALGRLAGGVAHDFNNLLTVILSAAESLRDRPGTLTATQAEELGEIEAAAGRANELTRQLLAFARRHPAHPVAVDLGAALARSERLLRRVLGEDVKLRVHAEPGLSAVCCDPTQVDQVVLNLAVNARDAMPGGGSLLLEAGNRVLDEAEAALFSGARPGRYVRLAATDDGAGMPPEVLDRVFEPFFTTKAPGKGTGLGLSTVHGIVAQAGGFVRARSEPGRGTTIEMVFPAADAVTSDATEAPPPPLTGGSETVLLVEDDPRVRDVATKALRSAGYRVLAADGLAQAEALVQDPERIDLVVADVVLPGRNGPQVVEALRARRPGLRALYVSGYPADAAERDGVLEPGADLLPKPFTPSGLLARVRAALDRRP